MSARCIVIGAGAVGTNLAILLDAFGFSVVLLEEQHDILHGAPQVTFISHGDGFEYYKKGHQETGRNCIEGSLTKALLYPLSLIRTRSCTSTSPIRFFISAGSLAEGKVSKGGFLNNAELMKTHYAKKYHDLQESLHLGEDDCERHFVIPPRHFAEPLRSCDYDDVASVVAGVSGCGFGVNMPRYYALAKSTLQRSSVQFYGNQRIAKIRKISRLEYEVVTDNECYPATLIFICASHAAPQLCQLVEGVNVVNNTPGTFFLNCMTFVTLPPTSDELLKARVSRVNFTLMERHGCMYACICPPTATTSGLAAIYYPDPTGSQRDTHAQIQGQLAIPPDCWRTLIADGVPNDDENVQTTFTKACFVYPFLAGYARISHSVCRTVFNASVPGNRNGTDRRVRTISQFRHAVTPDGRVSSWATPKWTNAELMAMLALDHAMGLCRGRYLQRDSYLGFGPTRLRVDKICREVNVTTHVDIKCAANYANDSQLPSGMIHEDGGKP